MCTLCCLRLLYRGAIIVIFLRCMQTSHEFRYERTAQPDRVVQLFLNSSHHESHCFRLFRAFFLFEMYIIARYNYNDNNETGKTHDPVKSTLSIECCRSAPHRITSR